ncbi:response regulator transcription factor [Streptomyces chartreusis]|uniref:response regulator transcription factor n=1 Tax=Streptomyces chartreusis TaxID=1969 RepID=UPI0036B70851
MEKDPLSLLGLQFLLSTESGISVAFTGGEFDPIGEHEIDCLVLDVRLMPRWLARQACTEQDYAMVYIAAQQSAGTVPDTAPWGTEMVFRSEVSTHLTAAIRRATGSRESAVTAPRLSPREQEVLRQIATGMTHSQVAYRIGISQHTVDTYVKRIRAKLGVGNKAQLVRAAIRLAAAAA